MSLWIIWPVVFLPSKQRLQAGWVAGLLVIVITQQIEYHTMKSGLPGVWWPLAQFFALQVLIGIGVERTINYAGRFGTAQERGG
jgi:hypothetical protein